MPSTDYKTTHPRTRQQWRQWLEKNHLRSPGIWLIYFKKESGKPRVSIADAVEEALCYGWIDSISRKVDDQRTMLKFTPRKSKSVWSQLNKTRIEKLIRENLMTPAGMTKIELAKKNGSWDTLTASDLHAGNNTMPADLEKALTKNKKALKNFTDFSLSNRKRFLSWIDSAKQTATRTARINQTVLMAAANKKPGVKGFKL
ncbi:MAG: YdeI/OmpD-associated family protein [Ferruginibacter sp.]|nr:YdeI/OmpD-associated family protein [Chitinophagaceae bacterium]